VVLGCGNGSAVVCNALLVQRGAPDELRGRAFAVLMSSNVGMLMLGMIVAGRLTDVVGARWVWAAAAVAAWVAAVVGFSLARRVAPPEPAKPELEAVAVTAHAAEPVQR